MSDILFDFDLLVGEWQLIGGELGGVYVFVDGKLYLGFWQLFLVFKVKQREGVMVEFKLIDIGKLYGGIVEVLKDINFDIKQGELVVFVGLFGCGKLIFFCMIVGLEKIMVGMLEIDGVVVNDVLLVQCGIVMVF